jgi:hypothetical protein
MWFSEQKERPMRLQTKARRIEARAAYVKNFLKGATKVSFKGLDAEAYLFPSQIGGKPAACFFAGNSAKPLWRYHFPNEEQRARRIAGQVEALKARAESTAKRKAEASTPSKIEPGHILVTCWGYDQTNREFFKVIAKRGARTLVVQELQQVDATTAGAPWMTGKALPGEEFRKGSKPYTVRVSHGSNVKIEGHYASVWDGRPVDWTAYA